MSTLRKIATPLTIGSFIVVGVTGVLWYVHIITDAGRVLHEIIGLAMVAIVGLHLALNWRAFRCYFKRPLAVSIIALFTALTVGAYLMPSTSRGDGSGRPDIAAVAALARADLTTLAPVFDLSPQEAVLRLQAAGYAGATAQSTPADLAGTNDARALMAPLAALAR